MKERREYIYSALTGISPEFIDEAAPAVRTRRPARRLIPIAACLCAALLIGSVTHLYTPAVKGDPISDGGNQLSADQRKQAYLSGYSKLTGISRTGSSDVSSAELPVIYQLQADETDDIQEVINYFGREIRPAYIPEGLHTPDEMGIRQTWGVYQAGYSPEGGEDSFTVDKAQLYYFERYKETDEITPMGNSSKNITDDMFTWYVHFGNEPRIVCPANRGVFITVRSTENEDIMQAPPCMLESLYGHEKEVEDALSEYHGVRILFYRETQDQSIWIEDTDIFELIDTRSDVQLCEGYDALLDMFLTTHKQHVANDDPYQDEWTSNDYLAWNAILKKNGFEQEDYRPYRAAFCVDGLYYELTSNLDFNTFAAITASLID